MTPCGEAAFLPLAKPRAVCSAAFALVCARVFNLRFYVFRARARGQPAKPLFMRVCGGFAST